MSELKTDKKSSDFDEVLGKLEQTINTYKTGFMMLMVHAGKITVDDALKGIEFERDKFVALCKEYNVSLHEGENQ